MMTAVMKKRQDPQLCLQVSLEMTESRYDPDYYISLYEEGGGRCKEMNCNLRLGLFFFLTVQ